MFNYVYVYTLLYIYIYIYTHIYTYNYISGEHACAMKVTVGIFAPAADRSIRRGLSMSMSVRTRYSPSTPNSDTLQFPRCCHMQSHAAMKVVRGKLQQFCGDPGCPDPVRKLSIAAKMEHYNFLHISSQGLGSPGTIFVDR